MARARALVPKRRAQATKSSGTRPALLALLGGVGLAGAAAIEHRQGGDKESPASPSDPPHEPEAQ